MNFLTKHKTTIILVLLAAAAAFYFGMQYAEMKNKPEELEEAETETKGNE